MEKQNGDIQFRGHCQCCGNQQAIVRGKLAKHGYTVKHGWFQGVCNGAAFAPIEKDRLTADQIIATVRKEAADLAAFAEALKVGEAFPKSIERQGARLPGSTFKREVIVVPFAEGSDAEKRDAIQMAIYRAEGRARAGISFARDLEAIADKYHGQPLIEVKKAAKAAPILAGEKRVTEAGKILTVRYQDGARVYWKDDRGFQGWTGAQAWRRMPIAG